MEYWEKFEKIKDYLTNEIILENVLNYFTSDQINDFCDSLITDYDLEDEFNEEN